MKKILLIEDDQVFANVYRNKLLLEGYQVEIAADGQEGYDLVESFRPDAVLLDLMLPKLSGIELIKKIRAQEAFAQLPLIVFTSTYLTSALQDAWKAGATKCLAKASCTPNQVLGMLQTSLNPKQPSPAVAPAPAAPTPPPPAQKSDLDAEFQEKVRQSFADEFPGVINALRLQLQSVIKVENLAARIVQLQQMQHRLHSLTSNASIVGLMSLAQLADALEALLKELAEKPSSVNASTLRTVASGVDCLAILFEQRAPQNSGELQPRILVVDDEIISRRAITHALDKARLKSVAEEDPVKALEQLALSRFDLIFLDVDMPGMNGYELCSKIRSLPAYNKTPIVFVTSLNDFEARANSTMSGGNDFIAKPFLFIELAVKALIYLLRSQFQAVKR